jgi:hypothetical protein
VFKGEAAKYEAMLKQQIDFNQHVQNNLKAYTEKDLASQPPASATPSLEQLFAMSGIGPQYHTVRPDFTPGMGGRIPGAPTPPH